MASRMAANGSSGVSFRRKSLARHLHPMDVSGSNQVTADAAPYGGAATVLQVVGEAFFDRLDLACDAHDCALIVHAQDDNAALGVCQAADCPADLPELQPRLNSVCRFSPASMRVSTSDHSMTRIVPAIHLAGSATATAVRRATYSLGNPCSVAPRRTNLLYQSRGRNAASILPRLAL